MAIMSSLVLVALSQNTTAVPTLDVPALDELVLLQSVMQVASDSADLHTVPTMELQLADLLDMNLEAMDIARKISARENCLIESIPFEDRSASQYSEIDASKNYLVVGFSGLFDSSLALRFALAKARGKIDDNMRFETWKADFIAETRSEYNPAPCN